ncbi:MAG: carboxypeptidase-like regulatory domain-containing protein [Planctomycetes bacterium]|nr:carboxypeptidase-like regulatory domain-containing protein [Planctomycetota bacterium]
MRTDARTSGYSISGVVLGTGRRRPMSGYAVTLFVDRQACRSTLTNDQGEFRIEGLAGSTIAVQVGASSDAVYIVLADVVPPEPRAATVPPAGSTARFSPVTWHLPVPPPDGAAARALAALPGPRHYSVKTWAAACGCSSRALFGAMHRWSNLRPKDILARHRVVIALDARSDGATIERCAALAEFASAAELTAACCDLGVELRPPASGAHSVHSNVPK